MEKYIFNVRKWNSLELNGRKETHTAYPVGNFLEFILLCNGQATTGCPSLGKIIFSDLHTMSSAALVCWEKLVRFQGRILPSRAYHFKSKDCLGKKYVGNLTAEE